MTWFSHRVGSSEVVEAPRQDIWDVLSDPALLSRMVSRVDRIESRGERWTWYLSGVEALGVSLQPSFTERMAFQEPESIRFTHDPQDRRERAGTDGTYRLENAETGTRVSIDITMKVDLPLPKAMSGAVERVMAREMERTGDAFARELRALVFDG